MLLRQWLPWFLLAGVLGGARWLWPRRVAAPRLPLLLLLLAAVHLPIGLAAAAKVGGGLNSYHGAVFGAIALTLALVNLAAAAWRGELPPRSRGLAVALAAMVVVLGAAPLTGRWRTAPSHHQDALLELAQRQRGGIIFPWNSLITLLSENRQLPTEDGLNCLELVGRRISDQAVRDAIPPGMKIHYETDSPGRQLMRYFPGREFVDGYEGPQQPGRVRTFGRAPAK